MRDVYVITTPENVDFEFEVAGVTSRALAWFIDLLVMMVGFVVVAMLLSQAQALLGGLAEALAYIAMFVIQWGYGTVLEAGWRGQTVGKRMLGLRTIWSGRETISAPALYGTGAVAVFLDPRGRRLGDLAAGTIVVRERKAPKPGAVVPASERHNTFIVDPGVVHAVRRITPPERDAMVALGLRRETLPLDVRHDLFGRLSRHLEVRLGVSRPSFFSEERFVLNLTAVVLAQG
ncbi:MAG: RDD family protein [Deltaproteobacteria bacterium]|nr:RDD family protein [Deltaproteobacteria bacterium]